MKQLSTIFKVINPFLLQKITSLTNIRQLVLKCRIDHLNNYLTSILTGELFVIFVCSHLSKRATAIYLSLKTALDIPYITFPDLLRK